MERLHNFNYNKNSLTRRISFQLDHKNFSKLGKSDYVSSNSIIKPSVSTTKDHLSKIQFHHMIDYSYHDYSHEMDDPSNIIEDPKRKHKGGIAVPFPLRLHQLLEDIQQDGHASIISWLPHGRAFIVHKPKEFVSEILPNYFKQSKIGSFQRQLNLYGFKRFTGGKDKGGYYHEYFLKDMSFLIRRMRRTKVKGTLVRGASNPETEPDFYMMPWVTKTKNTNEVNSNLENLCDDSILSFEGKPFHYISNMQDSSIRQIDSPSALTLQQELESELFDEEFLFNIDLPFDLDSSLSHMDDAELGYLLERMME